MKDEDQDGGSRRDRIQARRQQFADRQMVKGTTSLGSLVKRPGGQVAVTFGRTGVLSTAQLGCFIPFWMYSRLRWQFGERTWTVRVSTSGRSKQLLNRTLDEQTFASKTEGQAAAERILEQARAGFYDDRLLESE